MYYTNDGCDDSGGEGGDNDVNDCDDNGDNGGGGDRNAVDDDDGCSDAMIVLVIMMEIHR